MAKKNFARKSAVIKAMSIGLSLMMTLSTPVTVLASDAPDPDPNGGNTNPDNNDKDTVYNENHSDDTPDTVNHDDCVKIDTVDQIDNPEVQQIIKDKIEDIHNNDNNEYYASETQQLNTITAEADKEAHYTSNTTPEENQAYQNAVDMKDAFDKSEELADKDGYKKMSIDGKDKLVKVTENQDGSIIVVEKDIEVVDEAYQNALTNLNNFNNNAKKNSEGYVVDAVNGKQYKYSQDDSGKITYSENYDTTDDSSDYDSAAAIFELYKNKTADENGYVEGEGSLAGKLVKVAYDEATETYTIVTKSKENTQDINESETEAKSSSAVSSVENQDGITVTETTQYITKTKTKTDIVTYKDEVTETFKKNTETREVELFKETNKEKASDEFIDKVKDITFEEAGDELIFTSDDTKGTGDNKEAFESLPSDVQDIVKKALETVDSYKVNKIKATSVPTSVPESGISNPEAENNNQNVTNLTATQYNEKVKEYVELAKASDNAESSGGFVNGVKTEITYEAGGKIKVTQYRTASGDAGDPKTEEGFVDENTYVVVTEKEISKSAETTNVKVIYLGLLNDTMATSSKAVNDIINSLGDFGVVANKVNIKADAETNVLAGHIKAGNDIGSSEKYSNGYGLIDAIGSINGNELKVNTNASYGTTGEEKKIIDQGHDQENDVFIDNKIDKLVANQLNKVKEDAVALKKSANTVGAVVDFTDMNNSVINATGTSEKEVITSVTAAQLGGVQPGGLNVKLNSDQTLVINVNTDDLKKNDTITISRAYISVGGGEKFHGAVSGQENRKDDINNISDQVIYNFGDYSGTIKLGEFAGVVIAPCAKVVLTATCSGRVICDDFSNPDGEWHYTHKKSDDEQIYSMTEKNEEAPGVLTTAVKYTFDNVKKTVPTYTKTLSEVFDKTLGSGSWSDPVGPEVTMSRVFDLVFTTKDKTPDTPDVPTPPVTPPDTPDVPTPPVTPPTTPDVPTPPVTPPTTPVTPDTPVVPGTPVTPVEEVAEAPAADAAVLGARRTAAVPSRGVLGARRKAGVLGEKRVLGARTDDTTNTAAAYGVILGSVALCGAWLVLRRKKSVQ